MNDLIQWCRDTAKLYRERADDVRFNEREPWCLCIYISRCIRDGSKIDFGRLLEAIRDLPNREPSVLGRCGSKWAVDNTGYDPRADFLEDFAKKQENV